MNIHTPSANVLVKSSYITDIAAAVVNGSTIDTLGFTKALAVTIAAPSGTGTSSTTKLQDSPDGTTFTDVAGGGFAAITTAGGEQTLTLNVDLAHRQRYLRLVHTGAGGSASGQAVGIVELFNPKQAAVTQDNAAISV
jgi:hypothetical protein